MKDEKTVVKDLSFAFETDGRLFPVISDVSFSVLEKETLVLLGPSGCGKSTLLKCIAGLLPSPPDTILISGFSPIEAIRKGMIGFAFQDSGLLEWRSVEQNILLPTELGSVQKEPEAVRNRLEFLLRLTRLEGFRDFLPAQLSGGMKSRVSLARALIIEPEILLLDEPFGSLDLLTRLMVGMEFSGIVNSTDVATILVTHSVEEAVFLGTRVIVLSALPTRKLKEMKIPFISPRNMSLVDTHEFHEYVREARVLLLSEWQEK